MKTKNIEGQKVFVNVCKVEAIPPAKPISEEALKAIIVSEDYETDYKIPMSLGGPRKVSFKIGLHHEFLNIFFFHHRKRISLERSVSLAMLQLTRFGTIKRWRIA